MDHRLCSVDHWDHWLCSVDHWLCSVDHWLCSVALVGFNNSDWFWPLPLENKVLLTNSNTQPNRQSRFGIVYGTDTVHVQDNRYSKDGKYPVTLYYCHCRIDAVFSTVSGLTLPNQDDLCITVMVPYSRRLLLYCNIQLLYK